MKRRGVYCVNATFNNISVISWKPEYQEKTTDLPQVTDKPFHILLYGSTPRYEWYSYSQL
jgi:hypothetical protein